MQDLLQKQSARPGHPALLFASMAQDDLSVHVCLSTGTHAEGGIWATLFGLLMWDVLFMEVPDVFQTAFQTAPLDLGTVVFYPNRKDAIDARLSQVREGQGPALLQECWQQHVGEWCRGVNWDRHGRHCTLVSGFALP